MNYFYKKKLKSRQPCICGLEECAQISTGFQEINDLRGDMKVLPNSKNNSRKGSKAKFNKFYWKRLLTCHRNTANKSIEKQRNEEADSVVTKKDVRNVPQH